MVVSLPHQLSGFVQISNISALLSESLQHCLDDDLELPSLSDHFKIGQPVLCQIVSLSAENSKSSDKKDKKRIDLTLDPSIINSSLSSEYLSKGMTISCVVKSEEDHGFILDIGINGMSGFIKHKDLKEKPILGQVILGSITKKDASSRTAFVSMIKPRTALSERANIDFENLKAGTLLSATVTDVQNMGIVAKILDCFSASIDYSHMGLHSPTSDEIEKNFKIKSKIQCRVLYVDYEKKNVGLTLAPHLLSLETADFSKAEEEKLTVGDIKDVTVIRVDPGIGLMVEYNPTLNGYVHISKIQDEKIDKIGKRFNAGTSHAARIIGLNYCDGMVLLSMQPKVLAQPFVRLNDIPVGSVVKGEVIAIETFGVLVKITDTIVGLCPSLHLADISLSHPEKLFKKGAIMKFRVISKDIIDKKLILTAKKSIINSKLNPIMDYESVKIGDVAQGVIAAVKEFGVIVTFFNQVRAIVPNAELSDEFIKNPASRFKVGQPVKCTIIGVDAPQQKMKASFKMNLNLFTEGTLSDGSISSYNDVKVGEISEGIIAALKSFGSIVIFKNKVQAICPISEMPADSENDYMVGMKVKCRVLSVDADDCKMKVSFKITVIYFLNIIRMTKTFLKIEMG